MNYFCDSGGVIFHVDPERVFQGSANANVINFFGAFPSNAEVLISYELPDKTWTTPQRMTPIAQLSNVKDDEGNSYAGWQTRIGARLRVENGVPVRDENNNLVYDLDYTITQDYGTVGVQFFVYANGGNGLGAQIASARSSFTVEKGVPIVLPDTPTDDYEALLGQILSAISDKNLQIDTNAENIEALQNDLQETNENVTANVQAIAQNTEAIQTNAEDIDNLETGLSATNEKVQENERTINGIRASVSFTLGKSIGLTLDDEYKLTAYLYNGAGSVISKQTVDFPVESMVVSGGYDNENKTIILTLQNGNVVAIPVGDLVNGLISSTEKGQPNGVATLGADGKVPSDQLPAGQGEAPDLSEYVKRTDKIGHNKFGVAATDSKYGVTQYNGILATQPATEGQIDQQAQFYTPIVPAKLSRAVKVGLTANTETLTDEDKTDACDWLGAVEKIAYDSTDGALQGRVYIVDKNNNQTSRELRIIAKADSIPIRNSNGNFYVSTPKNQFECASKVYVDENAGTKWYKHTIEHVVDGIGIFDLLIVSTRNTAYTSGEEIYNDWIAGNIDTFFDSSLGSMSTKVCSINNAEGWHATIGVNADGYGLVTGTYTDNFESL